MKYLIKSVAIVLGLFISVTITACTPSVKIDKEKFKYEGELKGKIPHGQGKLYNGQVLRYEGEFVDGRLNGQGKSYSNNKVEFEGSFRDNLMDGKGVFNFSSGSVYSGDFKAGKLNGTGELKYPNGLVYIGEFTNDKMEGKGKLYQDGKLVYQGNFENNQLPSPKADVARCIYSYLDEQFNYSTNIARMSFAGVTKTFDIKLNSLTSATGSGYAIYNVKYTEKAAYLNKDGKNGVEVKMNLENVDGKWKVISFQKGATVNGNYIESLTNAISDIVKQEIMMNMPQYR